MEYKEVECRLVDHGIREYKKFKGIKIYSNSRFSEDRKKIIYQTIYLTPKKNLVYYQRGGSESIRIYHSTISKRQIRFSKFAKLLLS